MAEQHEDTQAYEEFPYGAPEPVKTFTDEQFRYLLNNDDTLVELEKYLRGIEYNPETEKWVKLRRSKMNELGINTVMATTKLRCSRGFNLGAFDKNEIREMIRQFSNDLNILMNTRYRDFDLDTSFIPIIHGDVVDIIWSNLTRTEGGWQQKIITKIWKGGEINRPVFKEDNIGSPNQGRIGRAVNRLIG